MTSRQPAPMRRGKGGSQRQINGDVTGLSRTSRGNRRSGLWALLICISSFLAAFKESVTLNLAQGSFKVIHFGGSRKPVYDFSLCL